MWICPDTLRVMRLHAEIRAAFPAVSLPRHLDDATIAALGLLPVRAVPKPTVDDTQTVTEGDPQRQRRRNDDGTFVADDPQTPDNEAWEWVQTWVVTNATPQEVAARRAARVPISISRFQARMALRQVGLFDSVEAMMAHPDTPIIAVEAWQAAQEFRRISPTIAAMGQALGLTDDQLDDLFIIASQIEA